MSRGRPGVCVRARPASPKGAGVSAVEHADAQVEEACGCGFVVYQDVDGRIGGAP